MEKVIPDLKSLAVFHRLLARSATGQPATSYTSHFRRPRPGSEMHVIIVDNWRSAALKDPQHWQTLKCIRCGACINTCPVYRRSGGYSYSYFVPGPVGINLGMLNGPKVYSGNVSACSLCKSCDNVCPVKVNLSEQIYHWRQSLDGIGCASIGKKMLSQGMSYVFDRPSLYGAAMNATPLMDSMVSASEYLGLHLWGKGRRMPELAKEPFHQLWKKGNLQDEEQTG